jgi:hypothetical protein
MKFEDLTPLPPNRLRRAATQLQTGVGRLALRRLLSSGLPDGNGMELRGETG